jgi:hypothetical protein
LRSSGGDACGFAAAGAGAVLTGGCACGADVEAALAGALASGAAGLAGAWPGEGAGAAGGAAGVATAGFADAPATCSLFDAGSGGALGGAAAPTRVACV